MAEDEIYRALFEQSNDAIFIIKEERILEVNPKGCKLLGYDKANLENISLLSLFTEESLPGFQNELNVTLENRSAFFETKIKRSDNTILDVEVNSLAMGDRGKTILLIARDITSRKESERLVRKEREILSALLKKSLCGVLLLEASSHKIIDVNPVAIKTIGRSKEEIVGNICHQFICPAQVGKCPISDLGLSVDNSEKTIINAQKEIIPILKSVVPVTIDDKEYFVECFIDLSESKRTEKKLLQAKFAAESASRAKSEFLANMSHELRTPLNSIIGFSDILLEKIFGDLNGKQLRYVNNISVSGKHLLELINDILDLSKVEAGKMELNLSEFSIGLVFDEVKSTISPLAQAKNLEMEFKIDPDLGYIQVDRSRLIQILYNLVSNAVKFTPERGKVSVYCKKSGNRVIFSVTDTGIGISSEDQKYLFEPFKQIDSGMNRQYGGTGLGLALVKKFVDMHKGRVWFTSVQGKGSSFIFELPINGPNEMEKPDNAFKGSATKIGLPANFSG
ncbi:PAS domain S-box protein [Methanosarcina sp. MSH10X1]|uniref:PAS domain-containing sensor histidine kinase n=1 Tax=Methanosarcina sp. MSH10X1 TaxID=2507075 RepID=UPI000FFC6155|nr:ATP-binding protein [Methanosarcina sp. MSH10X1]RXA20469.1 PAS domain S-box protein [Methanosarcina sp. MSH10X1]